MAAITLLGSQPADHRQAGRPWPRPTPKKGATKIRAVAISGANTLLTLGEVKAHDLVTALFAHARGQLPTPKADAPTCAAT